jgi:Ca2+-binding RTX toxin-like protein
MSGVTTLVLEGNDGDDVLRLDGVGGSPDRLALGATIRGGPGDDRLAGSADDDELFGDAGSDTDDASGSPYAVITFGTLPNGSLLTSADADDLTSIENLIGTSLGDRLYGGTGPNVLRGGDGNDTLKGLGGDDRLIGGLGHDTVDLSGATKAVDVDLRAGDASGEGTDVLQSVENARGGPYADRISGTPAQNLLSGGAGGDVLDGGAGADLLQGEDGADTLRAGSGNDLAYGHAGPDSIDGGDGRDTCDGGTGRNTVRKCEL